MRPFAVALAKLAQVSERLDSVLKEYIGCPSGEGDLAMAAIAAGFDGDRQYFATIQRLKGEMRLAAVMAGQVWSARAGGCLYQELSSMTRDVNAEEWEMAWLTWCERQTENVLTSYVRELCTSSTVGNWAETRLLGMLLECIIKSASPGRQREHGKTFRRLALPVARRGWNALASELVRWAAYCEEPIEIGEKREWVVLADDGCAMPVTPCEPRRLAEIYAIAFRPPVLRIPRIQELRKAKLRPDGYELVGDGFTAGFTGTERVAAADQRIWNGEEESFVSAGETKERLVSWRPCLRLLSDCV